MLLLIRIPSLMVGKTRKGWTKQTNSDFSSDKAQQVFEKFNNEKPCIITLKQIKP